MASVRREGGPERGRVRLCVPGSVFRAKNQAKFPNTGPKRLRFGLPDAHGTRRRSGGLGEPSGVALWGSRARESPFRCLGSVFGTKNQGKITNIRPKCFRIGLSYAHGTRRRSGSLSHRSGSLAGTPGLDSVPNSFGISFWVNN